MKIYIAHSSNFDFQKELFEPLKNSSALSSHTFIFPHETSEIKNSKEIIKSCSLVVAEVSLPSTGLGIELGWADAFNVPVVCLYKTGSKTSSSLNFISGSKLSYNDADDLIIKIEECLKQYV